MTSLSLTRGPRLTDVEFHVKDEDASTEKQHAIEIGYRLDHRLADENTVDFLFGVEVKNEKAPFILHVKMQALFRMNKKIKPESLEKAIQLEAAPLVHAVIRDFVADLTRRSEVPLLLLPTLNFDVMEKVQTASKR